MQQLVRLWQIHVDADTGTRAWGLLTDQERQRMERFRLEMDRLRFTISRGALRAILAPLLGRQPAEVPFGAGPHGKPTIAGTNFEFNCSHAGSLVLIALTRGRQVGVDVEPLDRRVEYEEIMHQHGSAEEITAFAETDPHQRRQAFFCWWTRKEAYFKGLGCGLLGDLRGITTWAGSSAPLQVGGWCIHSLPTAAGHQAALAVEAENLREEAIRIERPEWLWN